MKLHLFGVLREVVGQKSIQFIQTQPLSLRELLTELVEQYPELNRELFDGHANLHEHILIVVNGKNVSYLHEILELPISPQDNVSIFPAISGGSIPEVPRWL